MVLRGMDAPTTVTGRLNAADDRLDDLTRAQARGTNAVRNDSGHKLLLNPESANPLVVAHGGNEQIDSGLGFARGTLQVVSTDGQQWRNIEASGIILHDSATVPAVNVGDGGITTTGTVDATLINSSGFVRGSAAQFTGNVDAAGAALGANGIYTPGPANVGPIGTSNVTSTGGVGANGDIWAGRNVTATSTMFTTWANASNAVNTWDMTANGNVSLAGRAWNYIVSWVDTLVNWYNSFPSGLDLKEAFAPVDDADADALLAAPVHRWSWAAWMDEEFMPPEAEGPRNLVDRRPDYREHYGPVAEDVPEIMQVTADDGRLGIDHQSYNGLLLRICQRQQQQIDDLTARIDALETAKGPARGA